MATVYDFLGTVVGWHYQHCEPIVEGLYGADEPRARAALAAAWEAWRHDTELSLDERRALEYILLEFECSAVNAFYGDTELGKQFAVTYPAIAQLSPGGPLSDRVQAKVLLSLIGIGTRRAFVAATAEEVEGLLARLPEEFQTPNVWYYVVAWAFHNDYLPLLEAAMERQTVETTGWNDDYYWLRTNLMYQLVSGKAAPLDLEKTIKGYRHPRHIIDFRNIFLARCEQAGLMSPELYTLLERKEAELKALHGTRPAAKPKTVHVVKQL